MHHGKNVQDHGKKLQIGLFGTHQISIPSANFCLTPLPLDSWTKYQPEKCENNMNESQRITPDHGITCSCFGRFSNYFTIFLMRP